MDTTSDKPVGPIGRVRSLLFRWEETLAVIALCVVVTAVSYGVITRYITATPATWTTELAGLSFTWVVFLGAAGAMRRNMHVSIDAVTRLVPASVARFVAGTMNILVLVFLAYTTYLAVLITIGAYHRPSPVLRISFTWVYLAVVLGFGSMLLNHGLTISRALFRGGS
ncbi:MAG: TRAP transporter small permease [Hyphomicrobiales bacterium]|nr:TRAP transporter small permease [Hyphomicrobiales bacterium]